MVNGCENVQCMMLSTHNIVAVHNHGQSLAIIGLLEGSGATHQHVEDNSQTPDIYNTTDIG